MAILLVGIGVIGVALVLYPPFGAVLWWSLPVILVFTGIWELYFHGRSGFPSLVAGSLLVIGGASRALYQLVPMDEATGTVTNLLAVVGICAILFGRQYRKNE